jgi:hypothetical protein
VREDPALRFGGAFIVFFCCPSYFPRMGDVGEASHDCAVASAEDNDARVAYQVQTIARG